MDISNLIDKIGGLSSLAMVFSGAKPISDLIKKAEGPLKELIIEKSPEFKPKIIDFINKLVDKEAGEVKTGILITENAGNIYLTTVLLDEDSQICRAAGSVDIEKFILGLDINKLMTNGNS